MGLVDDVNELAGLVEPIGDAKLYKRVLDVERLALDLTRENLELQQEIKTLKEQLAGRDRLILKPPSKYYYRAEDGTDVGPVCPRCYNADGVVVQLVGSNPTGYPGPANYCRACRTHY